MEDEEFLAFLRRQAAGAQYVTSVCTGALLLGAAGLLNGYRAATHWQSMDLLPLFGAEPVHERIVIDGNRITGGGVTAGIDFGLFVAAQLRGERTAQAIQLSIEYDPRPPFHSGHPREAPPEIVDLAQKRGAARQAEWLAIAQRIAGKVKP
jgi:cyclohexyl-isocyanide hydratase